MEWLLCNSYNQQGIIFQVISINNEYYKWLEKNPTPQVEVSNDDRCIIMSDKVRICKNASLPDYTDTSKYSVDQYNNFIKERIDAWKKSLTPQQPPENNNKFSIKYF